MFRDIRLKDLASFYNVSLSTAKLRMKELKNYHKKDRVSLYDLAKYEGYEVQEVLQYFDEHKV